MDAGDEFVAHYAAGRERDRLTAQPSLELVRTQVLLQRHLPPPPGRVLDVGGASGVYAAWLAGLGYDVHLVDPVPLHVEQAAALGGFTAALGDARRLDEPDGAYDAVLLFGPLYHLVTEDDRLQALREARRVVRPGGTVAAAAISRYASTLDGYYRRFVDRPGFVPIMRADLRSGQHRNPTGDPDFFTTAYFHDPAGLASEIAAAGLRPEVVLPVEGPLAWAPDLGRRLADRQQRELVLEVLAVVERDPAMTSATGHLLAVAHR
ncbi:hypothetical protein GCM10023215_53680 [Pseudonocardia yuanmonensis]|uniref:Methyltransferase domain-containing protein n=1 Tax=Pseudonocardia yuanmonensis TaxID=1095914 RepID=A0ABP8XEL0_9PSEU